GPLARLNLVEFADAADRRIPFVLSAFHANPVMTRWFLGAAVICPHTQMFARQDGAPVAGHSLDDLAPLMAERRRRPIVIAEGAKGSVRRAAAAKLCAGIGMRLLVLDLSAAARAQLPLETAIKQSLLAARLEDAALFVDATGMEADAACLRLADAPV